MSRGCLIIHNGLLMLNTWHIYSVGNVWTVWYCLNMCCHGELEKLAEKEKKIMYVRGFFFSWSLSILNDCIRHILMILMTCMVNVLYVIISITRETFMFSLRLMFRKVRSVYLELLHQSIETLQWYVVRPAATIKVMSSVFYGTFWMFSYIYVYVRVYM